MMASAKRAASGAAVGGVSFIEPRALMRIKNLQLRARVIVEGFYAGIHRSPYHGFSVEFSEYRQYTPGDDLRYFDWRLFARSDRGYVKRFEDETNLLCYILADLSKSMSYGSGPVTKSEYARTMAATLAYFLHLQRDAVGLVAFDEDIVEYLPPRHRPGHLRRIMAVLQREPAGRSTNIEKPLEQIAQTVRKRGLVVLISDLLTDIDMFRTKLGYLRSRGHDVAVFRLYVDPEAARAQYLQRFGAHAAELEKVCRDAGADFVLCPTDRPLELSLVDLLRVRLRRSRQSRRRRGAGSRAAARRLDA
jgi:uncharacterized protein (DUF58 family)